MDLQELERFTKNFLECIEDHIKQKGEIIILSHENADVDACSSVMGLNYLLLNCCNMNPSVLIPYVPELNNLADNLMNKINLDESLMIQKEISNNLTNVLVIMVDNNNLSRLDIIGSLQDIISSIVIIDHHKKSDNLHQNLADGSIFQKVKLSYIDSTFSSCAEIITLIWKIIQDYYQMDGHVKKTEAKIDRFQETIAQILLSGIMTDSANLRYSNNGVLPILQFLISKGADLQKNRDLLLRPIDRQERIARIKGAIRTDDLILIKDWIVLYTTVNSFEASVCKSLIDLGADIAFCLSNKKGDYRLIVRTSENFSRNSPLNFASFMDSLGNEVSGEGGGHKGAAGMQGSNPPDNLKEIVISKLKAALK
jgi:nanoRNase/pAp phosphatase (c-di-AMP/oligoRNAs hydrolase)